MFIIAQMLGGIVLLLTVISVQQKTKERILMFQIIANILISVQYFLLNALTGGVVSTINIIRCIIFYLLLQLIIMMNKEIIRIIK